MNVQLQIGSPAGISHYQNIIETKQFNHSLRFGSTLLYIVNLTSDLFDEWSNVEGRKGGLLCWFDDHSVSTAQGRC